MTFIILHEFTVYNINSVDRIFSSRGWHILSRMVQDPVAPDGKLTRIIHEPAPPDGLRY